MAVSGASEHGRVSQSLLEALPVLGPGTSTGILLSPLAALSLALSPPQLFLAASVSTLTPYDFLPPPDWKSSWAEGFHAHLGQGAPHIPGPASRCPSATHLRPRSKSPLAVLTAPFRQSLSQPPLLEDVPRSPPPLPIQPTSKICHLTLPCWPPHPTQPPHLPPLLFPRPITLLSQRAPVALRGC